MDYRMISGDDHLDLAQLPADLWSARLPAAMRDQGPHIEDRDGRGVWVCEGKVWGNWGGSGRTKEGKLVRPFKTALERGDEFNETQRRPATPAFCLTDMDRDGVEAHSLFGPVTSMGMKDHVLRDASHVAYNDWLAEFCSAAPNRLLGIPMLPAEPESAVAELRRIAKMGVFRQVNLQIANINPAVHDARWEPFWSLLEETGLVLSFHVVVAGPPGGDPGEGKEAGVFTAAKMILGQFLGPFVDLFAWGILERHPGLKIVLAEGGTGWQPWVIQELDYRHWRLWEAKEFWDERGGITLKEKPSELFKRQIWSTFQEDYVAMALLPFYGEGHLLWASDYPHPDSTWPNSKAIIERQMGHLSPEMRKKLTHDNAAQLYGLAA